jgi:uncharacterized glyoxalase superfamily protein PhnB
MRTTATILSLVAALTVLSGASFGGEPPPALQRQEYDIPLARLSVSFDEETNNFDKVKVSFGDEPHHAQITRLDDMYTKVTRDGRERSMYPESPDLAFMISTFEAEQLDQVCETLVESLKQFEANLQKEKWGKCVYFDAYFPKFLKGFYYLYCAARNAPSALPRWACIPDSLFDVSLTSTKSDERVNMWRTRDDYAVRLRIAARELIYQTGVWRKKELQNTKRDTMVSYGVDFEKAYSLFVKIYFNLRTQ